VPPPGGCLCLFLRWPLPCAGYPGRKPCQINSLCVSFIIMLCMFLVCFAYSGAFDACALLTPFLRCCFLPWGMAHLIIAYFLFSSLCKIERRGVVRIRIRSRVIRIRVRRACIRTIVRVTASSTDTETYHAERCRQLPNVAARLCCRTKIFHPPDGGVGRFRPRPAVWLFPCFQSSLYPIF